MTAERVADCVRRWWPMTASDLPDVLRVAEALHADLPESSAVFAERLALFASGCLVTDGGYLIAHPARLGAPPPLDTLLGALPAEADALHLHDLALRPERQRLGLGTAGVRLVLDLATTLALPAVSLIAVHGSAGYWARFGFVPAGADVGSYGAGAQYMVRRKNVTKTERQGRAETLAVSGGKRRGVAGG